MGSITTKNWLLSFINYLLFRHFISATAYHLDKPSSPSTKELHGSVTDWSASIEHYYSPNKFPLNISVVFKYAKQGNASS